MGRLESLIIGIFLAAVPPMLCFFVAALFAAVLLGREAFGPWLLLAVVPGIIVDLMFLRIWIRNAYQIKNKILAAIYIFYSLWVFAFSMGIPLVNFLLGMLAGIYTARKMYLARRSQPEARLNIKNTALFTAVVMALIAFLMVLWAVAGNIIGSRVELFGFSLKMTPPFFSAVVLLGGFVLVLSQYWLTDITGKVALEFWIYKNRIP